MYWNRVVTIKKLLLPVFLLPYATGAMAIETYGEALTLAVENNPALARSYFDFAASSDRIDVVEGELRPSVDLLAVEGREDRQTPTANFGRYDRSDVRLTATQLLFDGYATRDRVRVAEFEARRDYQAHLRAAENAALQVTIAYLEVALYQRLKDYADQNYFVHRQVANRISERVSSGVSASVDLEQVKARLALAESNVLTEATNLHDTKAELQRITGARVASERLPLPLVPRELIGESRDAVLRRALVQSPRVRQSTEELLSVAASRDAARGAFFPRIDLRYRNDRSTNIEGIQGDFETEAIELVFNFNFYNGGSDRAQRRERNQRYYAAIEARKQACWDTRREVLIAYNDAQALQQQIDFLDKQLQSQRLARIAYEDEFDIGERTLLDLLDSQNELFDTQRALISAETGLVAARATALAEAGELLSSFGVMVERPIGEDEWGWDATLSSDFEACPSEPTDSIDVDFEAIYDRVQRSLQP
jgi:adhesin transport system outer membrane protein